MDQKSSILKRIIVLVLLAGLALTVMACGTAAEPTARAEPDPMENWENFDAIVATSAPPTRGPVAVVPPSTPTTAPSPTPPPAVMASDDSCVTCHTDQEMLIATAEEEEVVEALSEAL